MRPAAAPRAGLLTARPALETDHGSSPKRVERIAAGFVCPTVVAGSRGFLRHSGSFDTSTSLAARGPERSPRRCFGVAAARGRDRSCGACASRRARRMVADSPGFLRLSGLSGISISGRPAIRRGCAGVGAATASPGGSGLASGAGIGFVWRRDATRRRIFAPADAFASAGVIMRDQPRRRARASATRAPARWQRIVGVRCVQNGCPGRADSPGRPGARARGSPSLNLTESRNICKRAAPARSARRLAANAWRRCLRGP